MPCIKCKQERSRRRLAIPPAEKMPVNREKRNRDLMP